MLRPVAHLPLPLSTAIGREFVPPSPIADAPVVGTVTPLIDLLPLCGMTQIPAIRARLHGMAPLGRMRLASQMFEVVEMAATWTQIFMQGVVQGRHHLPFPAWLQRFPLHFQMVGDALCCDVMPSHQRVIGAMFASVASVVQSIAVCTRLQSIGDIAYALMLIGDDGFALPPPASRPQIPRN